MGVWGGSYGECMYLQKCSELGPESPALLLPPQVMHSDLKTKNVLLSNTMNAKISDVGLAQLVDAHSENAPVLAL